MRYILLLLLITKVCVLNAQKNYGAAHGHYSPTQTVNHNPATIVNSGTWLDFHIVGANSFLYNNYAYYPGRDFSILTLGGLGEPSYNLDKNNYDLYNTQDLHILSFTLQHKHHGFGFHARFRSVSDVRRLPSDFISFVSAEFDAPENVFGREGELNRIYFNTLNWTEFGVSYANAFIHKDHDLYIMGGTLNYLIGVAGGGIKIDNIYYALSPSDEFNFIEFSGSAAGAAGWMSGRGFSVNYGLQYKKMIDNVSFYEPFTRKSSCEQYDYKYKIGASITDLGYLTFNKEASHINVENGSGNIDDFSNNSPSGNNLASYIENSVENSVSIEEKESFLMLPPTAIHLQGDYNFENGLFLSAQYTHGLFRRWSMGVKHPHVLSVMPRFENKWFETSIPVSFYNYEELRMGLMFRFAYLTLGTDKLGTIVGLTKVTGYDIYVAFAYKFFKRPFCEKKQKTNKRNRATCPKF